MFGLFKKKEKPAEAEVAAEAVSEAASAPVSEVTPEADKEAAPKPDSGRPVAPPPELQDPAQDENEFDDGGFVHPGGMVPGQPSHIPGFNYSPVDPDDEFKATGGAPLPEGSEVASEETVVEALQTVYDPEIPVNIYDLGLIYGLDIADNGNIKIDMTLTAPGCPVAGEMPGMVARAVEGVDGTGEIEVTLVWEPQWTPDNMSEDAKLALGMA